MPTDQNESILQVLDLPDDTLLVVFRCLASGRARQAKEVCDLFRSFTSLFFASKYRRHLSRLRNRVAAKLAKETKMPCLESLGVHMHAVYLSYFPRRVTPLLLKKSREMSSVVVLYISLLEKILSLTWMISSDQVLVSMGLKSNCFELLQEALKSFIKMLDCVGESLPRSCACLFTLRRKAPSVAASLLSSFRNRKVAEPFTTDGKMTIGRPAASSLSLWARGNRAAVRLHLRTRIKEMFGKKGRHSLKDKEGPPGPLDSLPRHVVEKILGSLPFKDLARSRQVCKLFAKIASKALNEEFCRIYDVAHQRAATMDSELCPSPPAASSEQDPRMCELVNIALSCIGYTLGLYVEHHGGCFFAGEILDKAGFLVSPSRPTAELDIIELDNLKNEHLVKLLELSHKLITNAAPYIRKLTRSKVQTRSQFYL